MSGTDELIRGLAESMAKRFCNVIMFPTNYIETSESWLRECGLADLIEAIGDGCQKEDRNLYIFKVMEACAALRSKVVGQ